MLYKRLTLHASMEICCSFKNRSLVGLVGLVLEKTEVVYLKSFTCIVVKRTFQVKFSDPENEVDLILSRAGTFETLTDIDDFTMLGGVEAPIVDVECLKRCPAIVKVGLSRFQSR